MEKIQDTQTLCKIARDPKTPLGRLELLAEHPDYEIRAAVASNETATKELLNRLSLDHVDIVRTAVVRNRNASQDTIEKLSEDGADGVVISTIQSERLSLVAMSRLAQHHSVDVREAMAKSKTNKMILKQIYQYEIKKQRRESVFIALAENEDIPTDLFYDLFDIGNNEIKEALYKNKTIPEKLKKHLEDLFGISHKKEKGFIARLMRKD